MSGSILKLIALITMILDHIGAHLVPPGGPALFHLFGRSADLYFLLRSIGRISFPIYCFLISEGFVHTSDRRRYGLRLLLFALISEIPWNLEHVDRALWPSRQNVFFTLLLGYLGLCVVEKLRTDWQKERIWLIALAALAFSAHFGRVDYGLEGFGMVLIMYLLREKEILRAVLGICVSDAPLRCSPAFVLIHLYDGTRGFIRNRFAKFAFYTAYPLHIFLIWLIKFR